MKKIFVLATLVTMMSPFANAYGDLDVFPFSINFGDVETNGTSEFAQVSIKNRGNEAISGLTVFATGMGFTFSDTCPSHLDIFDQCTVSSRFRPTYTGSYYGNIRVNYNGGSEWISVYGQGVDSH